MQSLSRILKIDGYDFTDIQVSTDRGFINCIVEPLPSNKAECHVCGSKLQGKTSKHRMQVKDLPIMHLENTITFFRRKGFCSKCEGYKSEKVHFLSEESPHFTAQYAWCLKSLCEVAAVKKAAEHAGVDKSTLQRLDQRSLEMMKENYKIPTVTHIAVDEVYATKKNKSDENRDDRFFTIITDIKTSKVIWVEKSRSEKALTRFFMKIGERKCQKIQVVSTDQHKGYIRSVRENCPNAVLVLDKFHVIKGLGEAINEGRKLLLKMLPKQKRSKLMEGRYRFIFLKKANRRKKDEQQHIDKVIADNHLFLAMELIKERMYSFYASKSYAEAKKIFYEIGNWCLESGIPPLKKWYDHLRRNWEALTGFLTSKASTAVSEGVNNVIKSIKRSAFGFRNKDYFLLKIMQKCGYLNTKYMGHLKPLNRAAIQF